MRLFATLLLLAIALPALTYPVPTPAKKKPKPNNNSPKHIDESKDWSHCKNPLAWYVCVNDAVLGDPGIPGTPALDWIPDPSHEKGPPPQCDEPYGDCSRFGKKPGNVVVVKRSESGFKSEVGPRKEKTKPKEKPKKNKKPEKKPDETPKPRCPSRDPGEMTLCHFSLGIFCKDKQYYVPKDCVIPREATIAKRSASAQPKRKKKSKYRPDGSQRPICPSMALKDLTICDWTLGFLCPRKPYPKDCILAEDAARPDSEILERGVPPTQMPKKGKWDDGTYAEEELIKSY